MHWLVRSSSFSKAQGFVKPAHGVDAAEFHVAGCGHRDGGRLWIVGRSLSPSGKPDALLQMMIITVFARA